MSDARFEDGVDVPLHLKALDQDDLSVLSALVQDAVFPAPEMTWSASKRRFALLLNRFRWEAERPVANEPERVRALLVIEDAMKVSSQGIDRTDHDLILSLLSIQFAPGEDGTGRLELTLAGDGAISIEVEALDVTLKDVTRPYVAPSKSTPRHPE